VYHFEILLGLMLGLSEIVLAARGSDFPFWQLLCFTGRVIGTCAVFYGFFLCRMLGAGDIKLMAVCVGILGVGRGSVLLFLGMFLAFLAAMVRGRVWKHGWLMIRGMKVRLAPYLLGGYLAMMVYELVRRFI